MPTRFRPEVEQLDSRLAPAVFGTAWPTANLTLSFAPDGTDVNGTPSNTAAAFAGTPADVWQSEVLRAFQTWAVNANVNVGVVADGGQAFGASGAPQGDARFGDVRVGAVPLDPSALALGTPFDVAAGTRSGDVWFNSSILFGTAGYDTFSTVLHESGHVFGIAPSADPASAMFQESVVRIGLSAADVQALTTLYGARKPDSFDANKRNETLGTASNIRITSGGNATPGVWTADLTTATDVDVYEFRAEGLVGGKLTAAVRVSGYSLLVPRLEILDAAGRVIASGVGTKPGAGDVVLNLSGLTADGTYYARVTAGRSDVFGIGGYRLDLSRGAGGGGDTKLLTPDAKPNDTLDKATQLGGDYLVGGQRYGYAVSASLNTTTDIDFYRLRAPQSENKAAVTMTVSVWTTPPDGTDPVVDVYDTRGTRVAAKVLVHDGGAFTVQVTSATANADYYVAVRHARPGAGAVAGNYLLSVDFGAPAASLSTAAAGTLTAAAPVAISTLTVAQAQVFHLVFDLTGSAASTTAGARVTVVDASGAAVASRFVTAGDAGSFNVYLRPGEYRVIVGGGTLNGSKFAGLSYSLRWLTLSDPIGPKAVGTTTTPAGTPAKPAPTTPTPPAKVTPVTNYTPVAPVSPTAPAWWLAPPTEWAASATTLTQGLIAVK